MKKKKVNGVIYLRTEGVLVLKNVNKNLEETTDLEVH